MISLRNLVAQFLLAVLALPVVFATAAAQDDKIPDFPKLSATRDWPWWRGPSRNGIASDTPVPIRFSETDDVLWTTPVPGRGHSSPTVVGNRVYLTTADKDQQIHSVLAFDRKDGKQLWQVEVSRGGFPNRNHPKNPEATPTVACDGDRLYVTFFHHSGIQATALTLDGKKVWQKVVGAFSPRRYEYGYAPSPVLYGKSVIVALEYDGKSFLAGLDRATGRELWTSPRPEYITFSTPSIGTIAGKPQLIMSGADHVASYDPRNGKRLWFAPGTTAATCGTAVWDGDIVFASGGYPKPETVAVKADGSGTVLWKNNQKCYEQSMIAIDGYLYALTDNGVLFCWRGSDGTEMWKRRLQGPVSASPVFAGGHIYWANEGGTMYVFKPNPDQLEIVAENHLGNDSFPSPAICGGQIFLRVGHTTGTARQEMLYCFGKPD